MVLIVCARAPSREATWCLSTPVVARPTPQGVPKGFAPPLRSGFAFEHRGTGRFITERSSNTSPAGFSLSAPKREVPDFSGLRCREVFSRFPKILDRGLSRPIRSVRMSNRRTDVHRPAAQRLPPDYEIFVLQAASFTHTYLPARSDPGARSAPIRSGPPTLGMLSANESCRRG